MKLTSMPAPKNWNRLLPHPIALEFPDIDADTFNELLNSMRADGWDESHPIVVFEDMILDGRNRFRAVTEINLRAKPGNRIVPTFCQFKGDFVDAVSFSLRENLLRRHLTAGQKALIAEGIADMERGNPQFCKNAELGNQAKNGISMATSAAMAGVSPRTAHHARELKTLDAGAASRVKAGKESLGGALKKAKDAEKKRSGPPPRPVVQSAEVRTLHTIAAGIETFKELVNRVHAIRRDAAKLAASPIGRLVRIQPIEIDLGNAANALKFAAPFKPCPLGSPCDSDCKLCEGTQWISERQWEGVPKEMRNGR